MLDSIYQKAMSAITKTATRRNNQHHTLTKPHIALLAFITLSILWTITQFFSTTTSSKTKCLVSHGTYAGSVYTKPHETLDNTCLVESPWMRVAVHSVRLLPNSNSNDDGKEEKVIDDWLWIDYHDRINVLVEAPPPRSSAATAAGAAAATIDGTSQEESSFMILSQTKYALDQTSLAVVGGIIEPKEDALTAAQREVQEELKVTCQHWKVLGNKFRTDVNRGLGWVHPYLARDCSYSSDHPNNANVGDGSSENNGNSNNEVVAEVGGHDTEKQNVQVMKFSEVKKAVMDGKFVEVQWSNTVALAMLHLSFPLEGEVVE